VGNRAKSYICLILICFMFVGICLPQPVEAVVLVDDVIILGALALVAVGCYFATSEQAADASHILYAQASAYLKAELDQAAAISKISWAGMVEIWEIAKGWAETIAGGGTVLSQETYTINKTGYNSVSNPANYFNSWATSYPALTYGYAVLYNTSGWGKHVTYLVVNKPATIYVSGSVLYVEVATNGIQIQGVNSSGTTYGTYQAGVNVLSLGSAHYGVVSTMDGVHNTSDGVNAYDVAVILESTVITDTVSDTTWNNQWNDTTTGRKREVGWPGSWPSISADTSITETVGKTAQDISADGVITDVASIPGVDTSVGTVLGWLQNVWWEVRAIPAAISAALASVMSVFSTTTGINFQPVYDVGGIAYTRFPFCLPWDLANMIGFFNVAPVPFEVDFPIYMYSGQADPPRIQFDLTAFESFLLVWRAICIFGFSIFLILKFKSNISVGDG
jgi:hypothetical protein